MAFNFGATAPAAAPAFGAAPAPAFGAAPAPAFGAAPTPAFGAAPTPAFGASPVAFGSSLGAAVSAPAPAAAGFAFGGATPAPAAAVPALGGFGSPAVAFGAAPAAFGAAPAFGAASAPAFGAAPAPAAFGAAPAPVGFGAFGAVANPAASVFGGFGALPAAAPSAFGAFGAPAAALTPAQQFPPSSPAQAIINNTPTPCTVLSFSTTTNTYTIILSDGTTTTVPPPLQQLPLPPNPTHPPRDTKFTSLPPTVQHQIANLYRLKQHTTKTLLDLNAASLTPPSTQALLPQLLALGLSQQALHDTTTLLLGNAKAASTAATQDGHWVLDNTKQGNASSGLKPPPHFSNLAAHSMKSADALTPQLLSLQTHLTAPATGVSDLPSLLTALHNLTLCTSTQISHSHAKLAAVSKRYGTVGVGGDEEEKWREWSRRKIVELQIKEQAAALPVAAPAATAVANPQAAGGFGGFGTAPAANAAGVGGFGGFGATCIAAPAAAVGFGGFGAAQAAPVAAGFGGFGAAPAAPGGFGAAPGGFGAPGGVGAAAPATTLQSKPKKGNRKKR